MNLSTEKTPHQKLSNFSVDNVSAVNITHLATDNLNKVAIACDELNQQAGSNKAIPHVAARNIKGEKELEIFQILGSTKTPNITWHPLSQVLGKKSPSLPKVPGNPAHFEEIAAG